MRYYLYPILNKWSPIENCQRMRLRSWIVACIVLQSYLKINIVQAQNLWQPWYITPRIGAQHIDLSGTWELSYMDEQIDNLKQLLKEKTLSKPPYPIQFIGRCTKRADCLTLTTIKIRISINGQTRKRGITKEVLNCLLLQKATMYFSVSTALIISQKYG